jgi:Fe(3+) dicitrate transport protein
MASLSLAQEETAAPTPAPAAEESAPVDSRLFERVRVVGSAEASESIPGSVTYLDQERLDRQGQTDIHRILGQVPGVNVQEEEGYGLRPNIGVRGSGTDRSSRVTLMEDGVLIAPAPYAAPAAYYFPTVARMDGIELRMGSSSIQEGPFTTAGVLNLISSAIPARPGGRVDLALGEDQTLRGHFRTGTSTERVGVLLEAFKMETDGFKQLDGGGSTGFDLEDYLAKFRLTSRHGARRFHAVELKLGRTEQVGHETYLGLTQADFEANPFRRYSSSQEDRLVSDHEQAQLRYFVRPSDVLDLTATAYRNDFFRNWRKLGRVDAGRGFVDISDVLEHPAGFGAELAVLRGDVDSAADALNVRNNRRDYYSRGVDVLLGLRPGAGRGRHEVELGVRLHEDEEDRFQEEDLFKIVGGRMSLTTAGEPGSQSNRIHRAEAIAVHVQDTLRLERWTVTPGVRVESIDFESLNYGRQDPDRTGANVVVTRNGVDEVIPGIGVTLHLDAASRLFGGVHRGFAPPGPGKDEKTRAEESVNYEVGYRRSRGPLKLQVAGFYNDYENLLGADTLSSGGSGEGDLFNGGEVDARGVEASLGYDFGEARGLRVGFPVDFAYSYTRAEFQSSFHSEFEAWGDVRAGDELPYVAEQQASFGVGLRLPKLSVFTTARYQDRMRTEAGQGPISRDRSTDPHLVVDLAVRYNLVAHCRLNLQVRNLTDEVYVAARQPAGARPGLPRTAFAGVSVEF